MCEKQHQPKESQALHPTGRNPKQTMPPKLRDLIQGEGRSLCGAKAPALVLASTWAVLKLPVVQPLVLGVKYMRPWVVDKTHMLKNCRSSKSLKTIKSQKSPKSFKTIKSLKSLKKTLKPQKIFKKRPEARASLAAASGAVAACGSRPPSSKGLRT